MTMTTNEGTGFLAQILDRKGNVISEVGPYPTEQGAKAKGSIQKRQVGGYAVRIVIGS